MPRWRDLNTVSLLGNSITGVAEVAVTPASDNFENSGDDDDSLQRIDVTGRRVTISISVMDPLHKRDIKNPFFGGKVFTVNTTTDVITCTAHGLSDTDKVRFYTSSALPSGISANTTYYARDTTTDTLKIAATSGGSAIDLTTEGTGTQYLQYELNAIQRLTLRESGDLIEDSAEDETWKTYMGITGRVLEADAEFRDLKKALGVFALGDLGDLVVETLEGSATSGLADSTSWERFLMEAMTLTGINTSSKHKELSSVSMNWRGVGDATLGAEIQNTTHDAGTTNFEKNVGDTGTCSFVAPSADGGSNVTVTISNCVLTSVEITLNHGGRTERRFELSAYSSNGSTSPVALS